MSTSVEITWLLAAVAKGDAVAFERLYGATCANLYGVVLRILRRHDLAADVMEQAYLQIRRDAGQFDPAHSSPLAWMVAIARHLAIDLARGPQPPATDSEPEIIDEDEGPGTVPRHQLTDDLKRLLTCIGRLEPDRQRMLLLAYYGAFSREQLSSKLDMPIDLLRRPAPDGRAGRAGPHDLGAHQGQNAGGPTADPRSPTGSASACARDDSS